MRSFINEKHLSKQPEKPEESAKVKGLRASDKSTESIPLNQTGNPMDLGNNFAFSNITFEKFGNSSIITGEIENKSRYDFVTASFVINCLEGGIR